MPLSLFSISSSVTTVCVSPLLGSHNEMSSAPWRPRGDTAPRRQRAWSSGPRWLANTSLNPTEPFHAPSKWSPDAITTVNIHLLCEWLRDLKHYDVNRICCCCCCCCLLLLLCETGSGTKVDTMWLNPCGWESLLKLSGDGWLYGHTGPRTDALRFVLFGFVCFSRQFTIIPAIVPDSSFQAHILHFSPHPNKNNKASALAHDGLSSLQFSDVKKKKRGKKGGQPEPCGMEGSCSLTGSPVTPTAAPFPKASGPRVINRK